MDIHHVTSVSPTSNPKSEFGELDEFGELGEFGELAGELAGELGEFGEFVKHPHFQRS